MVCDLLANTAHFHQQYFMLYLSSFGIDFGVTIALIIKGGDGIALLIYE